MYHGVSLVVSRSPTITSSSDKCFTISINTCVSSICSCCFFFQAEDGIRDRDVTGVQTCALPISCHALVHLAAYALVGESVAEPEMYRANNVTAGRVLLERAAAAGVRRVVFSSSCAVYGHPSVTPIPEDAPLAPVNPYGETKRDFERMLAEYAGAGGATVVSPHYSH